MDGNSGLDGGEMTEKQLKLMMVKCLAMLCLGVVVGIFFTYIAYECVDCPPSLLGWMFGIAFGLMLFFIGISIGMDDGDDD